MVACRYCDSPETGAASAGPVRLSLAVQHHVPQRYALSPAGKRSKEDIPEIVHQAAVKRIVPCADGRFREKDFLFRVFGMNPVQGGNAAAVVVPGGTGYVLCGIGILKDTDGIVLLVRYIVEVVVVVEKEHLGLEPGLFESGTYGLFDEIPLLLPGHVQGHGIATVQGLVLQGNRIHRESPSFHLLYPLHKVIRIVGVILWIEAAAGPGGVGAFHIVRHLHPAGAAPGGADYFHVRIDFENLLQDREEPFLVQRMHGEVFHARGVAPGELVHGEVRPAYAYADK